MYPRKARFFVFFVIILRISEASFASYGDVFPPLDPTTIPKLNPNTSTVLTLCELWENDSIPVTPGIEVALQRIRPHFASKNIEIRLLRQHIPKGCGDESVLAVAPALVDMHLKQTKTGCSLVIGPSCTETMYNIRGLMMDWNIPVVTSGASGIKFEDKKQTTVLTRFGYTQEDVSMFMVRILDHFNWSSTVLLYDIDSYAKDFETSFQQVLQTQRMDLFKKTEFVPIVSNLVQQKTQWLEDQLLRASERSRVFIIAAMPSVVYQVMVTASNLGMTGPEYVSFLSKDTRTPNKVEKSMTGKKDASAHKILDSLLVIRMKTPADDLSKKLEYEDFSKSIKTMSRDHFNYSYSSDEQVTHLVLGIWDAVMLYGLAVNATLNAGGNILAGRDITAKIWGHSFMGIAIECTISQYGDRNFPYYLLDYDEKTMAFRPVILFDNEQDNLKMLEAVHWPGDMKGPPANTPRCGYTGKDIACQDSAMPLYGTVLIIIFCLGAVFTAVGLYLYRLKLNRINDDSWKIRSADIIPRERLTKLNNSVRSIKNLQKEDAVTMQSGALDSHISAVSFVTTAFYRESIIAIKPLACQTIHLSVQMLFELRNLRQMTHEHLAKFYGLCQDSNTPFIITEHCCKGSLTDLIENDSINLDWIFKFSLLNDIADGLIFIHNSPMKSHGRLTSNNCLIDGRFIVKISDLGLSALRPSFVALQSSVEMHTPETSDSLRVLLWRAPELLRTPMPPNGTSKGDIYSFAILLQQLAQRRGPFERLDNESGLIGQIPDVAEVVRRVRDALIPPYRPRVPFDAVPPELYAIMLRCWSELPTYRFDAELLRNELQRVPGNKSGNLMDDLLKRMEKYAKNLEELVNERTSAFMDEKKRSEDLLYQMLPRAVANKLKQGLYVEPETFESVTIYFSDIVGFTTLSASSTPMEVVDLLNDLYTLFDGVIEAYDVYKVETIGDAYVVVSGLPLRNGRRHACEIALMSLHVIAAIKMFRIRHMPSQKLAVRIGVHSGPCAAAMKIQVSVAAKKILEENKEFVLEYRGDIDLKGRGVMETYWLQSSSDLSGISDFKMLSSKTTTDLKML